MNLGIRNTSLLKESNREFLSRISSNNIKLTASLSVRPVQQMLTQLDYNAVKIVGQFLKSIGDLFFPPICLHCQTVLHSNSNELSLCSDCYQNLAIMPPDVPQSNILDRLDQCHIDEIYIAYQFNDVIQSIIHHIKYRNMPNLGIKTGELSANIIGKYFRQSQNGNLLPVPLHPIREKERGYNQSRYISKGIINVYGGNLLQHVLLRRKNTASQTNLNRQERHENVHQAFQISDAAEVSGKIVILVDDLITTGATINECARILKENGSKKIVAIAVASPVDFPDQIST